MLKRMLSIMLISVIMALFVPQVPTRANSAHTYELSDLDLTVDIPDKYSVITRETDVDDPVFSKLGITKEDAMTQFEISHSYLNALVDSQNEEIVVTMTPNAANDLNAMGDAAINVIGSLFEKEFKNYNVDILEYKVYKQTQTKFLQIHFYDSANSVYGMQYYTIVNGKAMNFTLRSYFEDFTDEQEDTIRGIVDSIKYNTPPATAEEGEETEAFVYTDEETGVSFEVPSNWKQEDFSKDRQFLDAKFVSTKEAGVSILYGSTDLWEILSEEEKGGKERTDIDNAILTEIDIADMYGGNEGRTSFVTYNGIEYYQIEGTQSTELQEMTFELEITTMLYVNDGWIYMYQFSGTSDSVVFSDFVSLLNSVKYASTLDSIMASDNAMRSAYDFAYKVGKYAAMFFVAVPIIIVVIVIIVVRKKKSKKVPNDIPKAQPVSNIYEPPMESGTAGETAVLSADMISQNMAEQPYLIRIRNNEKIIISTQMFRMGKDPSCVEYCINDNVAISRSHAYIMNYDGTYWLVDNNSTNRTYVNGMMLPSGTQVQLADGTRIHLADEEFEFRLS